MIMAKIIISNTNFSIVIFFMPKNLTKRIKKIIIDLYINNFYFFTTQKMGIENQKEILSKKWEEISLAIEEIKEERKKLHSEIKENEEEIWWYNIINEYNWYLEPDEKWFAIILSDEKEGGDTNLWIIVKYEEWKTTIRDTQQEPFWDEEYNKIELNKDEQIEWNDDINKINKIIKRRWTQKIKRESWIIKKRKWFGIYENLMTHIWN